MEVTVGLAPVRDGVSQFELVFDSGENAHYVGALLVDYILRTRGDHARGYTLIIARASSPAEVEKKRKDDEHRSTCQKNKEDTLAADEPYQKDQFKGRGEALVFNRNIQRALEAAPDEVELVVCKQCHSIADAEYQNRTLKRWVCNEHGEFGVHCECHDSVFCNASCLQAHTRGDQPNAPSAQMQAYLETHSKDLAQTLLLHQSYRSRDSDTSGDKKIMEEEIKRKKEAKGLPYAPPDADGTRPMGMYEGESTKSSLPPEEWQKAQVRSRSTHGGAIRVVQYVLQKLDGKSYRQILEEAPPELLREAREYHNYIHAEVKEKIKGIAKDHPDRKYEVYKLKLEVAIAYRKMLDRQTGYSQSEITKRHKDRMRQALGKAVAAGTIPKRENKGPAKTVSVKTEKTEGKRTGDRQRKSNRRDRDSRLMVTGHLCYWFVARLKIGGWGDDDTPDEDEVRSFSPHQPQDPLAKPTLWVKQWLNLMDRDGRTGKGISLDTLRKFQKKIADALIAALKPIPEVEGQEVCSGVPFEPEELYVFASDSCYHQCGGASLPCGLNQHHDRAHKCTPVTSSFPNLIATSSEERGTHHYVVGARLYDAGQSLAEACSEHHDDIVESTLKSFDAKYGSAHYFAAARGLFELYLRNAKMWEPDVRPLDEDPAEGPENDDDDDDTDRGGGGSPGGKKRKDPEDEDKDRNPRDPGWRRGWQGWQGWSDRGGGSSSWAEGSWNDRSEARLDRLRVVQAMLSVARPDLLRDQIRSGSLEPCPGAGPESGERVRTESRAVASCSLQCSPKIAGAVLTLLPVVVTAAPMELATIPTAASGTTFATLALFGSFLWHGSGVVEVAVLGVEEVVDEVVTGSKRVVQCFWLGVLFVVAVAVVKMGCCILSCLSSQLARWTPSYLHRESPRSDDSFRRRYGGRLKGGGKQVEGVSVRDVHGGFPPVPSIAEMEQVDPARLAVGDRFSFVYMRGTRVGERRAVRLIEKLEVPSGLHGEGAIQLRCGEYDRRNRYIERIYWPSATSAVKYEREPSPDDHVAGNAGGSGSGPPPAAQNTDSLPVGSSSSGAGPSFDRPHAKVAESKLALYHQVDEWKASKEWVEGQRGAPTSSRAANRAIASRTYPGGTPWVPSPAGVVMPAIDEAVAPAPLAGGMPLEDSVRFYTGCNMLPVMAAELESLTSSYRGYCYVMDHTSCCVTLACKIAQGVSCRLILDRANFLESSCARQADRAAELWKVGCEMRVLRPRGAGFPCMHVKTMIVDGRVVLTGSVNMTHNGLENNKEHLYRITVPTAVAAVVEDFDATWAGAEPVTAELIEKALAKSAEKAEKAKEKLRSKSVSRSLSRELGGAVSSTAAENG